ncbi:hypothetical protein NDU88_005327 [Pleurodeles waltl]|uniref:Uncharacterized protein n=1 Tax=Pleurodeles waltl TaxID=8319 RepID=A0AAV7VMF8_PLEWA|nr:hypothetical protein NDU88_005327 [Pleurodeles waltl]
MCGLRVLHGLRGRLEKGARTLMWPVLVLDRLKGRDTARSDIPEVYYGGIANWQRMRSWSNQRMRARLRVVDEGRTHIFPSHEDAWTWVHVKGLVEPHSEDPPEGTWLTPQPRRKKRNGSKINPSRVQAAVGQAQALLEAIQLTSSPYAALHYDKVLDSDLVMGHASGSTVTSPLGRR